MKWQGYNWLNGEPWGSIHPNEPRQWFDPSCVSVEAGVLCLKTKQNPKEFVINGDKVISQTGVGHIHTENLFHFGKFEIVAKLPKGSYLFPAIWLWGGDWDYEIDIIEASSNKRGSYLHFGFPIYKVSSNFHYKENGEHKIVGAKNMCLWLRNPANRFIKYGLNWSVDKIEIMVNDKVRRTISGDVMKYFQNPMRFILNNSVKVEYDPLTSDVSNFYIKSFKHTGK